MTNNIDSKSLDIPVDEPGYPSDTEIKERAQIIGRDLLKDGLTARNLRIDK